MRCATCLKLTLLIGLFSACPRTPPTPDQAWAELEKIGQGLQRLRDKAQRNAPHNSAGATPRPYPQAPLTERELNALQKTLRWLQPALRYPKDRRYAKLLRKQLKLEQQRRQDAQRGYHPEATWPDSGGSALQLRRFLAQAQAAGVGEIDPREAFHQALRDLGELRSPTMTTLQTWRCAHCLRPLKINLERFESDLAPWQSALISPAQKAGWEVFAQLQAQPVPSDNPRAWPGLALARQTSVLAAADVGLSVLGLARPYLEGLLIEYSGMTPATVHNTIDDLRRHPGIALATWLGAKAYPKATQAWSKRSSCALVPQKFFIELLRQGPADVDDLLQLADLTQTPCPAARDAATHRSDHPASADRPPNP